MKTANPHKVSASALVHAPTDRAWSILADYRDGHPRILPPQFSDLAVERGGFGHGTVIRFQMRLLGKTQTYRAAVTEPEPGRVLAENYLGADGIVTTFTVDPVPGTSFSNVEISTDLPTRSGPLGAIERLVMTRLLRPIYLQELQILDAVAARNSVA